MRDFVELFFLVMTRGLIPYSVLTQPTPADVLANAVLIDNRSWKACGILVFPILFGSQFSVLVCFPDSDSYGIPSLSLCFSYFWLI